MKKQTRRVSGVTVVTLGVAALAGVLLSGGVTAATWSAQDTVTGAPVTAGDLQLTVGDATWEQVTPGVADPLSGSLDQTPEGFLTMPGDIVEVHVPATTYLQGENINGQLTVAFADPASAPAGTTTTWHVEDPAGFQVAPATGDAAVGDSLELPIQTGSDAGTTQDWDIVITVEVGPEYDWVPGTDATPDSWQLGDILITLDQVREGPGYTSGAGG